MYTYTVHAYTLPQLHSTCLSLSLSLYLTNALPLSHTKVTVGAWHSSARCHVSLQLVLPQWATELPSNGAAHSSKLTEALVFIPPSQTNNLLATHWISLISLSIVAGCKSMATVDLEVLDLAHHSSIQHQLTGVTLLVIQGTVLAVFDQFLYTGPAEGVPTLDGDDWLNEDLLADWTQQG